MMWISRVSNRTSQRITKLERETEFDPKLLTKLELVYSWCVLKKCANELDSVGSHVMYYVCGAVDEVGANLQLVSFEEMCYSNELNNVGSHGMYSVPQLKSPSAKLS